MSRLRTRTPAILLERELKEAEAQQAIERLITLGPPAGSGIGVEAWRSWHRHGLPSTGVHVPTRAAEWACVAGNSARSA